MSIPIDFHIFQRCRSTIIHIHRLNHRLSIDYLAETTNHYLLIASEDAFLAAIPRYKASWERKMLKTEVPRTKYCVLVDLASASVYPLVI